eukprot:CAMPEP_0118930596 /NCGR_PEP_ID=MMETSP1169-20130426/7227_1 /TAXON_ID=36882 /ORGANISM="Pyramimonas obovata, Strain CCMP722" /LENGTH=141 /DNA_ID=CAMNT_0006872975 /DNA_START=410 /DNA_END=831 /DNA_ORIENTATION=-
MHWPRGYRLLCGRVRRLGAVAHAHFDGRAQRGLERRPGLCSCTLLLENVDGPGGDDPPRRVESVAAVAGQEVLHEAVRDRLRSGLVSRGRVAAAAHRLGRARQDARQRLQRRRRRRLATAAAAAPLRPARGEGGGGGGGGG